MLSTPDDAYRFAKGERIGLGPFDAAGKGQRSAQLQRPLDFAAVTDHAENIGEVNLCNTPGSASYDAPGCKTLRGEITEKTLLMKIVGVPMARFLSVMSFGQRPVGICGEDAALCRASLRDAWQDNQAATERHNDTSTDCRFTSFHGWEFSWSPTFSKVHRNVIFRNATVTELPASAAEFPDPLLLWEKLDRDCINAGNDCDVLMIPHNPNASNGRMFTPEWLEEPIAEQQRRAALRARMEPVVEMMQIKGESECKNGFGTVFGEDELCNFEKIRPAIGTAIKDCGEETSLGAMLGFGCQSRLDFVRYAIVEGMRQKARLGVNPLQFGFAGGTDTHNATPGDTEEKDWQGCCANTDIDAAARMTNKRELAPRILRNPGGLMGVWAEQNTRDAIFDAIRRRETFATSGGRIQPRLFAGAALSADACDNDPVTQGYASGVPMGGELGHSEQSPVFIAAVNADPGSEPLQRLQIIKVWYDEQGNFYQAVHDVAGDSNSDAQVDTSTCETTGSGAAALCSSWRDPQFNPDQPAAYYLRALENPSCRWSHRQCIALPEADRPESCNDPAIQQVIQERAWSSPIWYQPHS